VIEPDPRLLGSIVEQEAQRTLSEADLQPDPARVAAGWTRRFITDRTRLDEVRALYEELGFVVEVDSVRSTQVGKDCEDCYLVALERFVTVYTRRREVHGPTTGGGE
jgi:hypothetical protein